MNITAQSDKHAEAVRALADFASKRADVDPMTVARYGTGGVLAGGSLAAAISLVHAINLARRQRKELQPPTETDENTIVLTLPHGKAAEVKVENGLPVSVKSKQSAMTSHKKVPVKSYRAGFYPNQDMKKANWQTLTTSVLAAAGGGMLGYHIIDKAYQNSVQRKLKAQEAAARQEMLDAMVNRGQKTASEVLDAVFSLPDAEKSAQLRERSNFSYFDAPMAMAALMTLLGTGGTAYITKKILDNKLKEQEKEYKPPRVQRIVFKSAAGPLEPGEVQATADDLDSIKCAIGVAMDQLSGEYVMFHDGELAQALEKAGTSALQMYKWAQTDPNPLVAVLQNSPELRKMLQQRYMQAHPQLKYVAPLAKLPGIRGLADSAMYKKVHGATDQMFGLGAPKAAGFVLPSYVGSVLAEKSLDALAPAQDKKPVPPDEEVRAEKIQEYLNNIRLSATDPAAAAYLEANQDAIRALLGRMGAAGTLTPPAA